ncbi:hypothetical protein QFC21_002239 [Naganishia friedmannii]|uniref:Uncharacterized protein n=1 Tax=Naganishia friedmannii TaxID=89922 RepID=A0ACC2VWS8_9TREE|nr:hypothetical protein QFC21_002239 [Naganishia friedmannii]
MSTSVPSGITSLEETPKQAKVRIAAKLGLDITGNEREIAQRIKEFKATAGTKRKGLVDSQVSKRRKTNAGVAQSGTGLETQVSGDDDEDSQLQLIDPALLALSAGRCESEQPVSDKGADDAIARIQFNDEQPIHAQMDFLAHQTAADSRRAEPKASDATYRRHIRNYENFINKWNERQQTIPEETQLAVEEEGEERLQAAVGTLDPFPITADKAFFFVNTEKERGLGVSAIKQLVSALENRRINDAHLWRDSSHPLVDKKLREYGPIRHLEEHSQINEKNREGTIQALKMSGSSLDVVTEAGLKQCSVYLLERPQLKGSAAFKVARDRAMLLIGSQTGYRGANVRQLQWSDVRFKKIPVLELGASQDGVTEVNSLTFWANCHKHNQNGNVEELTTQPTQRCSALETSYRKRKRMRPVSIWLPVPGKTVRKNRPSRHMEDGAPVALSDPPTPNILRWMRLSQRPASREKAPPTYILPRAEIMVDAEIDKEIFPWVEEEEAELQERQRLNPNSQDLALESFLRFLRWCRTVILQDTVVLMRNCPSLNILQFAPFDESRFHRFSQSSYAIMEQFTLGRQRMFKSLPEEVRTGLVDMGAAMKGGITQIHHRVSEGFQQTKEEQMKLKEEVVEMKRELGVVQQLVAAAVSTALQQATARFSAIVLSQLAPARTSTQHTSFQVSQTSTTTILPPVQFEAFHYPPPNGYITPAPATLAAIANEASLSAGTSFTRAIGSSAVQSALSTLDLPAPVRHSNIQIAPQPRNGEASTSPSTSLTHRIPQISPAQLIRKQDLVKQHPKLGNHQWKLNPKQNEWYPVYVVKPCETVEDVWQEYTVGIGGHAPVRLLEELFEHHWKFDNKSVPVARSQRKRLTSLISTIAKQHPTMTSSRAYHYVRNSLGPMLPLSKVMDQLAGKEGKALAERIKKGASKGM